MKNHTRQIMLAFAITTLNLPCFAKEHTITLKPGESIVVTCDNDSKPSKQNGNNPKVQNCHTFHSDRACQGLPVGTACLRDDQKGICYQKSVFSGAPNCECK